MDARGFTLIEILIGITILAVGLLGVAGMFSTAYVDVNAGGKTTMAVTAARQIVEDLRLLPFPDVAALNGFNTNSAPPTSPPLSPAALAMARKWRYMVAGDGAGWNFTTAEKQEWRMLSTGGPATGGTVVFGGNAVIQVLSTSPTLRQVTVTVPVPGRGVNVSIATLISSL
jgi:prepilin-type N-terminal cleavage/methylation domain-containing protein